jgi:preprotein translocase subunit SecG
MNVFLTALLAVQMLTALGMIGLILVQHGKGADMGAAFGSGSSGSLFGASGSANFLSRTTAVLAAVFFACTLALAYFGNLRPAESGGSSARRLRPRRADPRDQRARICAGHFSACRTGGFGRRTDPRQVIRAKLARVGASVLIEGKLIGCPGS